MGEVTIKQLKETAKELRKTALTMIYKAQSGHPGGSMSAADIVTALYFKLYVYLFGLRNQSGRIGIDLYCQKAMYARFYIPPWP